MLIIYLIQKIAEITADNAATKKKTTSMLKNTTVHDLRFAPVNSVLILKFRLLSKASGLLNSRI